MAMLAFVVTAVAACGLIGSGLYCQCNRRRLNADPLLIAGFYLLGGFYLAAYWV